MKQLILPPRLQAVAELVPRGAALADVGTDHAYLPVWLLLQGRIRSACAGDIRPGPLARAQLTARQYDCADRMTFLLCDGLDGMGREDADAVVIAGMGGETICSILSRPDWLADPSVTLVLQPMSQQHVLRRWLWQHSFAIREERIAREGKRLYNIISASYGETDPMTVGEEWVGRQTPRLDQPLRSEYLASVLQKLRRALDGIASGIAEQDDPRADQLREAYAAVSAMREEWEQWQR